MEIFQQIWHALTTPNKLLIDILSVPLSFIEVTLSMLLSTTMLNVKTARKQRFIYILSLSIIALISHIFFPISLGQFFNVIIAPTLFILLFHTSILKGILSQTIPFIIRSIIRYNTC